MANVWRKRRGATYDSWHFCRNCSNWPTSDYVERTTPPSSGEQCDECKSKKRNNNCT